MLILCTACNHDIDTSVIELKERPIGNLIKVFFECPACGMEHFVMYHDQETRRLQKRMDAARTNGDMKTFNKLQPIFKKKLDKLNNR